MLCNEIAIRKLRIEDITFISPTENLYQIEFPAKQRNLNELQLSYFSEGFLSFNRFHFLTELPKELRNKGLGFKIYKAFIKHIGYVMADSKGMTLPAKYIIGKLAKDDEFQVVKCQEATLLISPEKVSVIERKLVLYDFLKCYKGNSFLIDNALQELINLKQFRNYSPTIFYSI